MDKDKNRKSDFLSPEEYDKLFSDLEQFDDKFYKILAKTEKYEIISTTLEDGTEISKEQLALLTRECRRMGYAILYRIEVNGDNVILFNPKSMKIGYITEGVH